MLDVAHYCYYMAFATFGYLYCVESIANMQSTGSSSDSALWPRQRDPQSRIVQFAVRSQAKIQEATLITV